MEDSVALSLAIVVAFCIYNLILGAVAVSLLRFVFVTLHFVQAFFRNVMVLPLLLFVLVVALVPYGVSPLVLNVFPSLEVSARSYELTQLAGTMLHLNITAVLLFLAIHWFKLVPIFMDTTSKLMNFFEMSLETFMKLFFFGIFFAILLVVDATVHPEVFKSFSVFSIGVAGAVVILLVAALEMGYQLYAKPERRA